MKSHGESGKKIKSVDTAFDIIEYLDDRGAATLADIVEYVDQSRSTTYYYLKTLQERRYVSKHGDKYRTGLRFLNLGSKALHRVDLYGVGEQNANNLADQQDGVVHIFVEDHDIATVIYQTPSESRFGLELRLGTETSLHTNAYGQSILAHLPENRRAAYFEAVNVPDHEELETKLQTVRRLGFALTKNQIKDGISSLAAPIFRGSTDEVVGSIGISNEGDEIGDPTEQYKAKRFMEDLPWQIQQTSRAISERLGETE